LNFRQATGVVNTCGLTHAVVLPFQTTGWPVTTPFEYDGVASNVPLSLSGEIGASFENGTFSWYNYTFPSNGGIWEYDELPQSLGAGAGLTFSYSPCG